MTKGEAELIINNPDHVLSFNPGSKKREVVGHHLFVDEKGYAVEKVDGVGVHFGGKIFVKGKLVHYTSENAPQPLDGLPTSVKYIDNSEKTFRKCSHPTANGTDRQSWCNSSQATKGTIGSRHWRKGNYSCAAVIYAKQQRHCV